MLTLLSKPERDKLYARANLLTVLTIGYNLLEGGVSVWLGAADETLALFGFGVDSFIEVISAVGVWHSCTASAPTTAKPATSSNSGRCASPAAPSIC